MIDGIYKIWNKKKIIGILLINVKKAFDYISRLKLT